MSRRPIALSAAVLLALTTAMATAPPEPPPMSANIRHLANVPKQPPFDGMSTPTTDLAFTGRHAIAGNFAGFTVYDIGDPRRPKTAARVLCPGAQNDVSVSGSLLFLSTDEPRSDDSCASTPSPAGGWEGIKIFDIGDPANPRYVRSIATPCGSHTNTLVPGRGRHRGSVFLYVSSYLIGQETSGCAAPHDKISIIEVPLGRPERAAIVAEPVLFPDGGNPGGTGSTWYPTTGCHDLTAYPAKNLMAGACMGDGLLMDIADPLRPRVITRVQDTENFAFWHSAVFNQRGDTVVFGDELGGGFAPTCTAATGATRGANAIYSITGYGDQRTLVKRGYYKLPREQGQTENCVAHYGSIMPVLGRDIMVQAWYQGGVSVWEFTDPRRPREIAHFDRGPLSPTQLILGGAWSAYYYNGFIYVADTQLGLDVLELRDPRTRSAGLTRYREFNPQTQPAGLFG
ncbi:hypothetical protein ABZW49_28415 [Nonomuraea wenchangensis]